MTVTQSLLAFLLAAGLLTVTPGLDTALVLRTATVEGARRAVLAALGINLGCLVWGAAVAFGLAALLAASEVAFTALKWAGAVYLCWLGLNLILRPRAGLIDAPENIPARSGELEWLWKGLFGNLLNPKVGVFYVSFLPQFVPDGAHVAGFVFLLACIHVGLGLLWSGALILAGRPLGRLLRRPGLLAWLDRSTGLLFIAFGLKLALARR